MTPIHHARRAQALAAEAGLPLTLNGDPRGWPLFIMPPDAENDPRCIRI